MNYAEAAYFDGAHVAHIAAWKEHRRLRNIFETISADGRRESLISAAGRLIVTGR
jgi:hypothetical protein